MRVTSLRLQGFRSFVDSGLIELGAINVLIGANNAGKSSVLRGLYLMQGGSDSGIPDVRAGVGTSRIQIGIAAPIFPIWNVNLNSMDLTIDISSADRRGGDMVMQYRGPDGGGSSISQLPASEPHHFIVPFLSKRKTAAYVEDVRNQHAMQVSPNMQYLAAKLNRISNPSFPGRRPLSDGTAVT